MTKPELLRRWLTLTSWLTVGSVGELVERNPHKGRAGFDRILREAGAVIETRGRARVVVLVDGGG